MAAIEDIYNFRQLSPRLATGGQPLVDELHAIGLSGFATVINLGLADAPYAVADEQSILESYAIEYLHIPVSFETPQAECFELFRECMRQLSQRKLFVHCAANKRVSVFIALYRVIEEGWSLDEALQDVHAVWQPDAAWQAFIQRILQSGHAPD
jgi:protein tyrosine phosphatase (PTP) superfamily phosphohydrolase (DUF442 family)